MRGVLEAVETLAGEYLPYLEEWDGVRSVGRAGRKVGWRKGGRERAREEARVSE